MSVGAVLGDEVGEAVEGEGAAGFAQLRPGLARVGEAQGRQLARRLPARLPTEPRTPRTPVPRLEQRPTKRLQLLPVLPKGDRVANVEGGLSKVEGRTSTLW